MRIPEPPASVDLATIAQAPEPEGILAGFSLRELPKGYLLSTPGSPRDQVFIVRSGRLRVYLAGESRALSLGFLESGDIYSTHTPTYVEAVTPTAIWLMDTRIFAGKLAADPTIAPAMMRVLGRLLADSVALIEDLAFREVPARLARFFLGLAERRGQAQDNGCVVRLDFGMQEIADLVGTTRQTISALINQWEREGLLERQDRRTMLIHSLVALRKRCAKPI